VFVGGARLAVGCTIMESLRRGGAPLLVAATAALIAPAACSDKDDLPPPRPGVTTSSVASGGGASAGPNLCECLATVSLPNGGPCVQCFDDVAGEAGTPCNDVAVQCDSDPECLSIKQCMADCGFTPGCISACALPFDQDTGHQLYQAMIGCACGRCGMVCVYPEPLKCDGTDGLGGAGGAGGLGGAGGAGGGP
jgi:hypothetical protein